MKKIALNLFGLALASTTALAQDKNIVYWQDKPSVHTVSAEYAGESAVILDDNIQIKYVDEADKQLWMYMTVHRTVKILDEKGIESFNKMTVPMRAGQTIHDLKARTILANGTVIDVTKDRMKESQNEDGSKEIVFAMEGVEKNAEVEFFAVYKRPANLFGRELFQFTVPLMHSSFELLSPARLKFEEKGYNGFPTVKDTLLDDRRYMFAEAFKTPALQSESYSFLDVNRARAEYKVSYLPNEKESVRVFTWQELAQRLYNNSYPVTDKEARAVEKYLVSLGVNENDDEEAKIKKIENGIKSGITLYKELLDENASKLDNIIAKKAAAEGGMIRLFAVCFEKAGVKNELGITTDKKNEPFDEQFENWNYLENYLFYFPNQKKFLSPAYVYYRYPFTATDVLGSNGVFCKQTTLGDITNAVADVRKIPARPVSESQNNIKAEISFNNDMEPTVEVTTSFTGYCAMGLREYAVLLPKDKTKELVQSLVTLADKPESLVKYAISGEAFDNYYSNKPLQIVASVSTPQLVEKAGPKYIFRVGDVIGRQVELYQSTERKLPIDIDYPHELNRTIVVNIPAGYQVSNPEAIKIQAECKDETGKVTTAFYSDYKIEGNKMTVNITEFYGTLHFPVSSYEPFRKVINASADFNKITLVLSKI
jgi:hypothetical protein